MTPSGIEPAIFQLVVITSKVKAIHYRPVQAQMVRLPDFKTHEGGKVVSPTHRPPSLPRKYSWYSFLLEAESTPGP